jgi:glycine cleavage system H protein
LNVPEDLKYTKSHEWVRVEGDIATVGITDFAQSELGDVVFVELPAAGRAVRAGDTFGSVESVKTVSDVYAPVSGEVVDVNAALGAQSELINTDPFGKGYMVKIKMSDPGEAEKLMDANLYKGEIH